MTQRWIVPPPGTGWSLFLDVDGTLLDFASRPDGVQVPRGLVGTLARLREQLDGRLALVSGRSIGVLDSLFAPLRPPAAGIHGLERRDAAGALHRTGLLPGELDPARAVLRELADRYRGLILEDKGISVALHYRLAPLLKPIVLETATAALSVLPPGAHLQHGNHVVEVKSAAADMR
jgi:trehalose 6-phosphate phosphatase